MIKIPSSAPNRKFLLILSLSTLLCLSACDRSASTAPSASSTATSAISLEKMSKAERHALIAQLMQTAFGKKYNSKQGKASANLRDLEKRNERSPYQLTAEDIYLLPDQQILLVANAQAVLENGEVIDSHATGGLLNLFWFSAGEKPGTWKLSNRAENIANLGSHGMFGSTQMSRFADKQSMLTVENGGTWQGYTVSSLDLFHVTNNAVHALGGVLIHSDSEGGCGEETGHCWNISAKWKLLPAQTGALPDLQLTISGVDENMPEEAASSAASQASAPPAARISKKVAGSALYRVKGSKYALLQGENIIPTP